MSSLNYQENHEVQFVKHFLGHFEINILVQLTYINFSDHLMILTITLATFPLKLWPTKLYLDK